MSDYYNKIQESRVNQKLYFHRLYESIMYNLKERIGDIIQDHVVEEIDPPLFDLRNYIVKKIKSGKIDRALDFQVKLIPLYSPILDEVRKGLNQLFRHEYGLTEKARQKVKDLNDLMKKLDLTVKYRIELHDKKGKIDLSDREN